MKLSPEFLQKVKSTVNLVDVVGEHVVLRKAGANLTGLCPFHSERTPSFSVNESKQVYYCYGCQEGGDLISFVTKIFGISFPEAVAELADRANVALPKGAEDMGEEDPEARARRLAAREKTATALKLNRFVASFFHQQLSHHALAADYISRRGVSGELLRNFYVGVAPAEWDALAKFLVSKKAPLPLAAELGLIRPSVKTAPQKERPADGPGYFDLFRNRAIFPILDTRGKVAGFGGRSLPLPEGGEADGPKYLNSSESFVFQKSKLAFGLYQAQKFAREKDEVIIVEGYFDVLALHAAGFQNVVATCGTSLTPDHLNLLRKFAGRITILFDGDKAGVSATERAMELGLAHGFVFYGAAMPQGLDPDEILFDQKTGTINNDGVEKMKTLLTSASPLIDKAIDEQIQASVAGPEARTQALKQIARWLASFKDQVGREVRVDAVQRRMGVNRALLEKAAAGERGVGVSQGQHLPALSSRPIAPGSNRPQSHERVRSAPGGHSRLSPAERILIRELMKRAGEFRPWLKGALAFLPEGSSFGVLFDYPPARQFIESLLIDNAQLEELGKAPHQFLAQVEDPRLHAVMTEACMESPQTAIEPERLDMDLRKALEQRLAKFWARFSQQIKLALAEAEAKKDAGLQARLMKDYLDVQRKMKEFNSFYDEA